jgi:N-acetyl-alpha-D-glucosaminyl L-malate synthase BshA
MRIGITCYPTYGGSGIVATELGRCLADRGHTIHFISYAVPQRLDFFSERVVFHEVEILSFPLFEYTPYSLALATTMLDVVTSEKLDLLHVHYAIPHAVSAYLAQQMIEDRKLSFVTTLHGTDVTIVGNDPSFLPVTRFSIEKSTVVTAVSEYLKRVTCEQLGVGQDIRVIYNFVDTDYFKRDFSPELRAKLAAEDETIVLHISNFRKVKRIGDVVKAFEIMAKEVPSRLLFVGDGPERPAAERLCRKLDVCDKISFLGKQEKIVPLLSVSDILLMPSEEESFGVAALEAMCCEIPVVATRAGGLVEVVEDGVSGFLFQIGDVNGMAQKLAELGSDTDLRIETGKAGRERALEMFSPSSIVPMYERAYEDSLDRI